MQNQITWDELAEDFKLLDPLRADCILDLRQNAAFALYNRRLIGGWAKTFVATSVLALYFNVLVLVVQLFQKVPLLKDLAPTQSELPFQIAQLCLLMVFLGLGVLATARARRLADPGPQESVERIDMEPAEGFEPPTL